ncbi:hypothetical protein [Horticoccus sp. 23ND18S-11]|uniref:hypothetical protein n=1 Tax=Horticoccus sp. 23ND18S-11 TaxID=3391832 RepID=UPI0039C93B26
MTHNSTRKHFFAKLLGVVAATSMLPKLFSQSVSAAATGTSGAAASTPAPQFKLRHDARAVARRDSV